MGLVCIGDAVNDYSAVGRAAKTLGPGANVARATGSRHISDEMRVAKAVSQHQKNRSNFRLLGPDLKWTMHTDLR
jgi:hypothetical protein